MCNLPNEIGFYWARRNGDPWENIVEIKGVKPFLTYRIWHLKYPDKASSKCNTFGHDVNTFVFGDKICFNSGACQETIKIDKPGVYVIFGKCLKLAYIAGTSPYMKCWVWDIERNTRYKCKEAWNLSFTEYVKKPNTDE